MSPRDSEDCLSEPLLDGDVHQADASAEGEHAIFQDPPATKGDHKKSPKFGCDVCGRSYQSTENLRRHLKKQVFDHP